MLHPLAQALNLFALRDVVGSEAAITGICFLALPAFSCAVAMFLLVGLYKNPLKNLPSIINLVRNLLVYVR